MKLGTARKIRQDFLKYRIIKHSENGLGVSSYLNYKLLTASSNTTVLRIWKLFVILNIREKEILVMCHLSYTHEFKLWIRVSILAQTLQLNEYETDLYFLQLIQNMATSCLPTFVFFPFLPEFPCFAPKFVLFWCSEQFSAQNR